MDSKHFTGFYLAILLFTTIYEGNDVNTSIGSIRIMRIFYWLTVIILVATYSGNLTAHLAVEKFQMPFTTLQELADDNKYSLLILKSTSTETLLKVKPPLFITL